MILRFQAYGAQLIRRACSNHHHVCAFPRVATESVRSRSSSVVLSISSIIQMSLTHTLHSHIILVHTYMFMYFDWFIFGFVSHTHRHIVCTLSEHTPTHIHTRAEMVVIFISQIIILTNNNKTIKDTADTDTLDLIFDLIQHPHTRL